MNRVPLYARMFAKRRAIRGAVLLLLIVVLLALTAVQAFSVPSITATKNNFLLIDKDADNVADPGDTIRYSTVITNSGSTNATNVAFQDTIDANTTLIAGSVRTTPIARHDFYTSIGNVGITVPAGSGILANDNDPDGTTPTLTIVSALAGGTANGGAYSIAADGSFAYLPPLGYEGTDQFQYTVQDADGNQDPATVFIVVSEVIWFIDNSAPGGGNGRLNAPFNSLADYNAVAADETGDIIFVYESGSGNYTSGITLLSSQILVGQGATPSLATIAGLTIPTHSNALPTTGGSRPVITNSGGSGVTLGSNNLLRGFNVGDTSTSSGAGISGSSIGNLQIQEMSLSGTRKAVDINGGGTLNVNLDSVVVTSSTNGGVSLQNVSGTTTIGTLNIATTAGTGFLASNAGTVNVNSAAASTAAVNSSGGPGINVSNSTFNATFTSVVVSNSSGLGVRLDNNSGATNITGSSNTVSTTGGTAVNISNSTIGSSGITFLSVSAASTDVGIRLNNTGTGDFTVTGSGTTDGSGGTLSNLNDHGIELTSAQDVSISNMNLTNAATTQEVAPNTATCTNLFNGSNLGCNAPVYMVNANNITLANLTITNSVQHGINGNNVNGLSISNTDLTGIGNESKENGMHFINLLGTVSFNNVSVIGSDTRNVLIENNTGNTNMTVTNSTFNTAGSEVGLDFLGLGTANITFNVTDSSFSDNYAPQLKALAEDNSVIDATITGNSFDGNPLVSGNSGIDLAAVDGGTITFDVIGTLANPQTFQPFRSHAINVYASGAGTASGKVNGNTINGSAFGAGIQILSQVTDFNGEDPSITIEVDGNNIDQVEGVGLAGIHIEARDGTNGLNGTSTIDATVTNNTVRTTDTVFLPVGGADAAIQVYLSDLNPSSTPQNRVCINATGNATQANGGAFGETDFFFGNDAVSGTNSGVGIMQGFATSVSNTWFTVNSNTTTTSPTPLATSLGPIGGGTCATVASITTNQTVVENQVEMVTAVPADNVATLVSAETVAANNTVKPMAKFDETLIVAGNDGAKAVTTFKTAAVPALSGETINLSLGDLNPGQQVAITFDVTVDSSIPANVVQVCNQGLVTGSNFADVLTDDPDVGGATDPTCRPVEPPTLGTIVIRKTTTPSGGTGFSFQNNITAPFSFTLDDGQSETFLNVPAGSYEVTEDDPGPAYKLTALACLDPSGGTSISLATRTVSIDLAAGETVECTFTNTDQRGTIIINKVTSPNGGTGFGFTDDIEAPNSFTLNDGQDKTFVNVLPGSYTLTEDDPGPAYKLTALACLDPSGGTAISLATRTVSVDLAAGETVECTFTNTDQRGTIIINKVTSPNGGTGFGFTDDIEAPNSFTLNDGQDKTFVNVLPGSYTLTEDDPGPAYALTALACLDPSGGTAISLATRTVSVDLAAGETVECTFTNLLNQPPVASNDSFSTNEDTTLTEATVGPLGDGVLANDTDADGDVLTAVLDTGTSNGALALNSDGSFTYTPSANYCGADSFTYHANDGTVDSNIATVDIDVVCINDAPVANNDSYSTIEDIALVEATVGPLGDGVLANDTDADGDALTAVLDTGTSNGGLALNSDGSFTYTPSANYCGADSFTYHANDGTTDSNTATVNIDVICVNDAPAIDNGDLTLDDAAINENESVNLSGSFADPDDGDSHTVTIDWGDGSANTVINLSGGVRSFSAGHQYLDDNPSGTSADDYTITVTVVDTAGASDAASTLVNVANVAPQIGAITAPAAPVNVNEMPISVTAVFTDPGALDTHVAVLSWGDGSADTVIPSGSTVSGSHSYAEAGVYTVGLTVSDDDSGTETAVYEFIVIYDPAGGFVTGGGWIDSPAGAYTPDPTLTGRATFGFVSKYKKGASVPTGNTVFQFNAGDLKFQSDSYDWLVIAGAKAMYKGTGTINGSGNFGFMLTAIDAEINNNDGFDVDRFRIRIWDKDDGDAVVYDNQVACPDSADDADPCTDIGGGSIVIHKGGKGGDKK